MPLETELPEDNRSGTIYAMPPVDKPRRRSSDTVNVDENRHNSSITLTKIVAIVAVVFLLLIANKFFHLI